MSENDYQSPNRYIWTTEKDKWFLLKNKLGGYGIRSVTGNKTTILKIEDNQEYEYVVRKMLENGSKVYTVEEYYSQFHKT